MAGSPVPLHSVQLKVSRPVAACTRCRNAKIKCDGKLPVCSSCEKNGRAAECISPNDLYPRGKERSYVATLESRLKFLEAKLAEIRKTKADHVATEEKKTGTQLTRAQKLKEATIIDDLVSDFGFLSVNATSRDFYGFTSAMSYDRLILWSCSREPLPSSRPVELPPRHEATVLLNHYFKIVFSLLPVLDETAFYRSVDNLYGGRHAEPNDHWVVRMALAISCASKSTHKGDCYHRQGLGHVCEALKYAREVLHPGSISSVQALVLLAEYSALETSYFDTWELVGAASRAMIDLGLHQDPPTRAISKYELELRRRVFYCVYSLDRATSIVQARAFSFSDDSTKVKVPYIQREGVQQAVQLSSRGQFHGSALNLIRMRQIQSKWYTDLYQSGRRPWDDGYGYIWIQCDTMAQWFNNLESTTSPTLRNYFELDLLQSYVYVLSPSPRVPVMQPFAAKLIFEYVIRYASIMHSLICVSRTDGQTELPFLTFHDAMRVNMMAQRFLDVLRRDTESLLSGYIPPPPAVDENQTNPPTIPTVAYPRGERPAKFNASRSVNCIKQLTECLKRFGARWAQPLQERFEKESAPLLNELEQQAYSYYPFTFQ
ncbi:hypothetical protein K470DRAFT_165775 [Piedraia hortae CBS 480.64]|uniref:Zn(2)-C6 fungal-type domain-containing protein n=1 Tax=Piedraia hortae CBS 480.64 TaxID=1314780 RepID=A0A6A7C5G9_9PEZI|nr:hypothetical protein K470DRAFT_165775 [Piedraia hortae CBS 480.64]